MKARHVRRCLCATLLLLVGCTGGSRPATLSSHPQTSSGGPTAPTLPALPSGSVAVAGFTGRGGTLLAVDRRTGRTLWATPLPMSSVSEPLVVGHTVVVAGTDDCYSDKLTLAAVSAKTGRPSWQTTVGSMPCGFSEPLFSSSGQVVAGGPLGLSADPAGGCDPFPPAVEGGLALPTAMTAASGASRWRAPAGAGEILAASDKNVVVRGPGRACLASLASGSGKLQWSRAVAALGVASGPSGLFLFSQRKDGRDVVSGLDLATGADRWQAVMPKADSSVDLVSTTGAVTSVVAHDTQSKTTTEPVTTSFVQTFDPATGHLLWQVTTVSRVYSAAGQGVIALVMEGDKGFSLEARDARTGRLRWQSALIPGLPYEPNSPVIGGSLVVLRTDREAEALNLATGKVVWQVPGAFSGAAVGTDAVYLAKATPPKNARTGD